ncbi:Transposase InsO and inactivated derivatives [Nonomuraea maritima]|uniref:Transposase InsO and inactivated derivatives n=1 Tax=Nonomuraea maritima TaxID=683260 RepID=A0A1G9MV36_9ACTN|nr:Transposase InsO and inactivated derivatives [Nonomuraea maritima]
MALVELSVVEQRYHAVIEVLSGAKVTDVAGRYGVSRQSVHSWVRRYQDGGLAGLADRSHAPKAHPMQTPVAIEALICELRRAHPRWGPRTLLWELGRRGVEPLPSRASIYRVLVRNGLVSPVTRRRRREDYRRWERPGPMQLWQMDIMGGLLLADGTEAKLITGVDDHSRFCVIASVVTRPTGRLVCAAFAEAMRAYGVPLEVLTDNGKQFTGRFGGPKAGEVLFERVCRENGIKLRHTAPRTPTTTGKIERFHQSVRRELLAEALPFASLEAAQSEVEAFAEHYNTARPHQALDMAFPADRFFIEPSDGQRRAERELPLHLPAGLTTVIAPAPETSPAPCPAPTPAGHATDQPERPERPEPILTTTIDPLSRQAIEVDRIVPASGNLSIGGQQLWLGPDRAGMPITLWISTQRLHVFTTSGGRLKSVASRLSVKDLAALLASGQARPAPTEPIPEPDIKTSAVEVDRQVSSIGTISLAGRALCIGAHLAGRRVTVRLDGITARVMDEQRLLLRAVPCPLPLAECVTLRNARPAGPPPTSPSEPVTVQRVVCSRGHFQVVGQKIQVGRVHARKILDVTVDDTHITVHDNGEPIRVVPRTTTQEITRIKSTAHTKRRKIG